MWKMLICDEDKMFLQSLKKQIIDIAGNIISSISCFSDKESFEFHLEEKEHSVPCIAMIEVKFGERFLGG